MEVTNWHLTASVKRSTDHISSHLDPMCATSNIHLLPSSAAPRFKTGTHVQQITDLLMVTKRSDFACNAPEGVKKSYKALWNVLYVYKNKLSLSHSLSMATNFSILATDSPVYFYLALTETQLDVRNACYLPRSCCLAQSLFLHVSIQTNYKHGSPDFEIQKRTEPTFPSSFCPYSTSQVLSLT